MPDYTFGKTLKNYRCDNHPGCLDTEEQEQVPLIFAIFDDGTRIPCCSKCKDNKQLIEELKNNSD